MTDEDKNGRQVPGSLPRWGDIWTDRWTDQDAPDAAWKTPGVGGRGADTAGDTVTELRRLTSPMTFWCQNLLKKGRRPAGQWDMDMRGFRGSEDLKVQN